MWSYLVQVYRYGARQMAGWWLLIVSDRRATWCKAGVAKKRWLTFLFLFIQLFRSGTCLVLDKRLKTSASNSARQPSWPPARPPSTLLLVGEV